MARKQYSRPIDILAAAAADDQVQHFDNHSSDDDDDQRSGSGSEVNKLSGSDPDSTVIPNSPRSKSSRKRSAPKHLLLSEFTDSSKKARVDKSSGAINRVWSEQDEIAILQGMIDFKLRKGEDPYRDMNAFIEFVQERISVHVSRKQLTDKIRRLKNKYFVNVKRGDVLNGGKEHDVKLFELSEMIWGGDGTVRVTKDKEDGNVVENGGNGKGEDEGNVVENGVNRNVIVAENGVEGDDVEGGNVVGNGMNGNVVAEDGIEGDDEEEGNVVENGVNGNVVVAENGVEGDDEEEGNVVENGVNENVVVEDGIEGDDEEGGNVVENGVNGNVVVAENGIEGDDEEEGNVVENGVNGNVVVAENGVEGDDVEGGKVVENGMNGNVDDGKEEDGKDFKGMYPYLSRAWESEVSCSMLMKSFLMDNIGMVGNVELREMDTNWKNFYVEQLNLYVKRLDLEKANAQAVLGQLATSDS